MPVMKLSLPDRVAQIRADADAYIDSRAAEVAKETPGVPFGVIRNLLTVRAGRCQCQAVLNLVEDK